MRLHLFVKIIIALMLGYIRKMLNYREKITSQKQFHHPHGFVLLYAIISSGPNTVLG